MDEEVLNEIQVKYLEKKYPMEAVIEIYKEYDRNEDIDLSSASPTMIEPIFAIVFIFIIIYIIFKVVSRIFI